MKPFETALEAELWIAATATGDVECYVWTSRWVIGGFCYPQWRFE